MQVIYKIVLTSGHSYVGMTDHISSRLLAHESKLRRGKLGTVNVPNHEYSLQILDETDDWGYAYQLEKQYIDIDKSSNPLNCNKLVQRSIRRRTSGSL